MEIEVNEEVKDENTVVQPSEDVEMKPINNPTPPLPAEISMTIDEKSEKYEEISEEVDWDKNLEKAIQFSMKRSEINTRKSGRGKIKKIETLSLQWVKDKILENEEEYTEVSAELNRAWAPYKEAEKIRSIIIEAEDEETIWTALLAIEEGFSNPMTYKSLDSYNASASMEVDVDNSRDVPHTTDNIKAINVENKEYSVNNSISSNWMNKVIDGDLVFYRNNRKVKKFWSSDSLKDWWRDYIASIENGGICNLFFAVCVFLEQTEVCIL